MTDRPSSAPSDHGGRSIVALLVAMTGTSVAYTALATVLGLQVYDITHHELDLGLIGMAQFAPSIGLVLLTGAISDRFERARVAALSVVAQGLVALLLAGYAATQPTDPAPIFGLVVAFGAARSFLSAAQGPLPADIIEPARLPWLMARRSLVSRFGQVAGPILGGFLYVVDRSLVYLVIAVVFGVAAVAFAAIRPRRADDGPRPARPRPTLREAFEGIVVIRRTPLLFAAISLDLFAVLFGGAIALLPAIAEDRLGTDAVGLGVLRSATGIGSIVVLAALAARPVERAVGRTLLASVAVFGAATVALGLTTSFVVAFLAVAILSGADSISVFIRSNVVPLSSPVAVRGRVAAVNSLFIGASNELGAFESGVTGEILGSGPAVVLGGAATLAVVGLYATRFPALRALDRYPEVEAGGPPVRDRCRT